MIRSTLGGIVCLLFFCSAVAQVQGAEWKVKFGPHPDQVRWLNASVVPHYEEASALGPMSFRLHGGNAWIADSLAGRLLCVAPDGKIKGSVVIPGVASNTLLEDFALVQEPDGKLRGAWVADGADLIVRFVSIPEGKELLRVGGPGNQPGQFKQIHQVEVSASGRLYVGDYGRGTITIFDPLGKLLFELPWEKSGFAVTPQDTLHTVIFSPNAGYALITYGPDGNLLNSAHLGHPAHQNPRIWSVDRDGQAVISFIPPSGFRGILYLQTFSPEGMLTSGSSFRPPQTMNRFLTQGEDGSWYVAVGDFEAAPRGFLTITGVKTEIQP